MGGGGGRAHLVHLLHVQVRVESVGIGHCRGLLAELVLRHDVKPNHLLVALNRELVLDVLDAQIRANRPVPVISSRGVSFPFHFQRERIVFQGGAQLTCPKGIGAPSRRRGGCCSSASPSGAWCASARPEHERDEKLRRERSAPPEFLPARIKSSRERSDFGSPWSSACPAPCPPR